MTAWVVFLGASAGVIVFVFGPGWARSVRDWFRPEPLAPFSRYQDIDR